MISSITSLFRPELAKIPHILESSDSWPLLIVFHSPYITEPLQSTIGQLDQDKAMEMGN